MLDFGQGGLRHAFWTEARGQTPVLPLPRFPLNGADATAQGVEPGPLMGELLNRTRLWWRDQGCTPTRDACLEEFRRLLAQRIAARGGGGTALGG